MYYFNRVHIIGYQTQPVQVRQTPQGTSVTDLNLVVPYRFRAESGEMLDGKGFHTVTLWGPMADVAGKYIRPGTQVFFTGRLQTDSWEDEKTGEKRSKTKIIALDMIILDPKAGQSAPPEGAQAITQCLNRVDLIGNVTRDPEMRTTTGGQQVLTLGVATNESWKDRQTNEIKERTEFHNVVLWGALADTVSKTVKKGNKVFVTGRVQTRSWETKEGSKRYTTEVVADAFSLLGISHPSALESIQSDAMVAPKMKQQDAQPSQPARGEPVESTTPVEVPSVAYASEIKPEDLPF